VTEHIGDGIMLRLETGRDWDHFPGCKKCFFFSNMSRPTFVFNGKRGKAGGTWSWTFTSIWYRSYKKSGARPLLPLHAFTVSKGTTWPLLARPPREDPPHHTQERQPGQKSFTLNRNDWPSVAERLGLGLRGLLCTVDR